MNVKDQVAFQGRQSYCDVEPVEVENTSRIAALVHAANKLLENQPKCSRGSVGDLRQERLRKAIADVVKLKAGVLTEIQEYLRTNGDHFGVSLLERLR